MSVGGVFQLINNKGIQDKLIMATEELQKRIKEISYANMAKLKSENPFKSAEELAEMKTDWFPTLAAIEKSHIMFTNASFKPFVALAHEYSKTPPRQGIPSLGSTFSFTLPIIGEFVNDAVMYVKLTNFAATSALDKVRYVELLGHRLMKNVTFKVQNHAIDSYTSDNYNVHLQYKVPQSKELGYLRNIGQEIPKLGYLTADPTVDEVREYRYFGNGPQTFKTMQSDIELWIPLLFWFKDIQCSLPNFILPMGQVDIEVQLEEAANLVAYANYGGGGIYTNPKVSECYLHLNHIFMLPEVSNIFISKFGFQLIRVHRNHTEIVSDSSKSIKLHQIKWPIECLYVAFRPRANLSNSQIWHRNMNLTSRNYKSAVVTGVSTIQVNNSVYYDEEHCISNLELRAHDIVVYPSLPPAFYNNYLPYRYGENMRTPKDLGWYMLNFNVNPGEYQPSGHFNVSRDRELYLSYTSAVDSNNNYIIRNANPVDLIVVADVLNFLLYKDGNMLLKFST